MRSLFQPFAEVILCQTHWASVTLLVYLIQEFVPEAHVMRCHLKLVCLPAEFLVRAGWIKGV